MITVLLDFSIILNL